jgi:hypothetical protein
MLLGHGLAAIVKQLVLWLVFGRNEGNLICKSPYILILKSRLQALSYPLFAILGHL